MRRRDRTRSRCPIARSLELVGDRWTLLVLRDLLLLGKTRFRDFLDSPEGIASNILAARLKKLEAAGLLTRAADPDDRRRFVYTPTDKGLTLLPLLREMAAWGETHGAD